MFKDKTIEKRVMTAVRSAIEQAQTAYEEEVEAAEREREEAVAEIHAKHEERVDGIVNTAVRKVFASLQ